MLYNNYINPCARYGTSPSAATKKAWLAPLCIQMERGGKAKRFLDLQAHGRQTAPILSFKLYPLRRYAAGIRKHRGRFNRPQSAVYASDSTSSCVASCDLSSYVSVMPSAL